MSKPFTIEDNELLNERTQLVAAGKMALLRLGRYISDASAAPLTNGNVEKLVKLVALLESAENDFLMGGLHLWLVGVMPFTRAG